MIPPVHIIGGGLAGSEAAWQLALAGVPVILHEMRPVRGTEAHQTDGLAELVCSNSFRSDDWAGNAVGLLHEEMRRCGSLILAAADANKVPAGGALAVDRDDFSAAVGQALDGESLVQIVREEIDGLPPADWDNVIVATGPLTSPGLSAAILDLSGEDALAFFDAITPIVHTDSIDLDVAWSDIPRIAFKSMAIIVQVRRRCNGFPSVAIRQSRFDDLAVVGSPFDQFCRHPDTPFPSISPRRRFPRPTPERVFVVDHQSSPRFSGTIPSARQPRLIGT